MALNRNWRQGAAALVGVVILTGSSSVAVAQGTAASTVNTAAPAAPSPAIPPTIARRPGKIGGVQLPAGGAYEPQCGPKPVALAFSAADVSASADRASFTPMANAYNAYVVSYGAWRECVIDNIQADAAMVQASLEAYQNSVITPETATIDTLAKALRAKSVALTLAAAQAAAAAEAPVAVPAQTPTAPPK